MPDKVKSKRFRDIGKWCAYALALLAPGSFFLLPVLWLARAGALRRDRASAPARGVAREASPSRAGHPREAR